MRVAIPLLSTLAFGICMGPALAASPLTDATLDSVTAGNLLGVVADATASALGDTTTLALTRTRTFANPHVAVGHAFAIAHGDLASVTAATVIPIGTVTHVESHTVTTPSGLSISQSNGVAH